MSLRSKGENQTASTCMTGRFPSPGVADGGTSHLKERNQRPHNFSTFATSLLEVDLFSALPVTSFPLQDNEQIAKGMRSNDTFLRWLNHPQSLPFSWLKTATAAKLPLGSCHQAPPEFESCHGFL